GGGPLLARRAGRGPAGARRGSGRRAARLGVGDVRDDLVGADGSARGHAEGGGVAGFLVGVLAFPLRRSRGDDGFALLASSLAGFHDVGDGRRSWFAFGPCFFRGSGAASRLFTFGLGSAACVRESRDDEF